MAILKSTHAYSKMARLQKNAVVAYGTAQTQHHTGVDESIVSD